MVGRSNVELAPPYPPSKNRKLATPAHAPERRSNGCGHACDSESERARLSRGDLRIATELRFAAVLATSRNRAAYPHPGQPRRGGANANPLRDHKQAA